MKFSQMPYTRPDLTELKVQVERTVARMDAATTAQEQLDAYYAYEKVSNSVLTMVNIAHIRHTIDTRDPFYAAEQDWVDGMMPQLKALEQQIGQALLRSPFRKELGAALGDILFTNMEIAVRSFKPELMPLMAEENRLTSEYQNLYASARVEFDGKTMPLPMLGSYKRSLDRAVRKAAYDAEGSFFESHREELDSLYDKLVKNRTAQAKLLGYENYIPLGYDRMCRNCYGPAEVEAFRRQVEQDLVPMVLRIKENQRQRLGLEHMYFHDDLVRFPDGNPAPMGTPEDILKAGRQMYRDLSPETGEFIDFMYENDLLDVCSKDGKAPGGYCTSLPDYRAPFVFSNFNGTAGDVDVLTHELGHAFASFRSFKNGYIRALQWPTLDGCECHSMSMEFLTREYHRYFFGDAVGKYDITHCEEALFFIPYGCLVDEFQHGIYSNPDMTPEDRHKLWASLEKKYRPWLDFGDIPFYGRGAGWQRQTHIYQRPFYYIDYSLAQTISLQFWIASLNNPEDAWKRYLAFTDLGGTRSFTELILSAGLELPFAEGSIRRISQEAERWLQEHTL